jgi:6-pyruvoyltetrahydropterin/6-carboxytetrahydropterin synthase
VFTIKKRIKFSASHRLEHLINPAWPENDPRQHQCSRLHGHNYIVEVELQAELLDERGFVVDYGELRQLKAYIDEVFDHRHINDVLSGFATAENLALYFYGWCKVRWPQTAAVRVSETPETLAEYRPAKGERYVYALPLEKKGTNQP